MREKFSHGAETEVFRISPTEKALFPKADLVKEDISDDRLWFVRLFYRHEIAYTLFPDNFIQVVGASVEPHGEGLFAEMTAGDRVLQVSLDRVHKLFSVMARVSPDHAIYSSHMAVVAGEWGSARKKSTCPCEICARHRREHQTARMREKAKRISESLVKTGIFVDPRDPSDYCLAGRKIIFFEIGNFRPDILKGYLESLASPSFSEQRALRLLERHDALLEISRKEFRKGTSSSVRHH